LKVKKMRRKFGSFGKAQVPVTPGKVFFVALAFILLFNFLPFGNYTEASEETGPGVVYLNGKEMYKDKYGNLYPIWEDSRGKKQVRISDFEYAPLEALLERDRREGKGEFIDLGPGLTWALSIVSYNQNYVGWRDVTLGFGPTTIGSHGCFLTSSAMSLATYNLTISGSLVDPLNLNEWMKNNGGFYQDLLIFDTIANFPGISSVGYSDSLTDAIYCIYSGVVPILKMYPTHYSPLNQTDGTYNRYNNYIENSYHPDYYRKQGIKQSLYEAGYYFETTNVFRYAFPGS
jgi:hypothetical protein